MRRSTAVVNIYTQQSCCHNISKIQKIKQGRGRCVFFSKQANSTHLLVFIVRLKHHPTAPCCRHDCCGGCLESEEPHHTPEKKMATNFHRKGLRAQKWVCQSFLRSVVPPESRRSNSEPLCTPRTRRPGRTAGDDSLVRRVLPDRSEWPFA